MNILYTNFHKAEGGGHTTYVLALTKNAKHNKYVACPESSRLYKALKAQGYEKLISMTFPSKPREFMDIIKATWGLKRVIEKYDIDIIHTNGSQENRLALYASLITRKKFKVIFTKHNSYKIKGRVSQWRFNAWNDAVIFVTDYIYKTIGFSKFTTPIHVIENGIDLDYWKKRQPVETGHILTLVSNAGLSLHKGWTYLTDAIHALPDDLKARLKVMVIGPLEMDDVQALAKTKCSIEFPGFMADARPLLERADIGFLLSYGSEASSFACKEMMGMSLPMIVSDYTSLPKSVDEGCGWMTKLRDAESIKAALLKILSMAPEQLNEMKHNARKKAEANYSIEIMLEKTNEVYESIAMR